MFESVGVNSINLIDIEVQFRCLPWDSIGNLSQFGVTASDHGARTCALWRAIVVTQATLRVVPCKKYIKRKTITKRKKTNKHQKIVQAMCT